MKVVLEGLEKMKYIALYCVHMYNKRNDDHYRYILERIVEKTIKVYGLEGLTELLDFIHEEQL